MLERIGQTFEALEQEVAKGTIRSVSYMVYPIHPRTFVTLYSPTF